MSAAIVSLCGRAEKGVSRPFFCESDDGSFYYVKSGNVAPDRLVTEYVISRLGEECGLPVAPFGLVELPGELAKYALVNDAEEFQPGLAFGSVNVPFADEVRTSHLRQIDEETKLRCLCFDWWIGNSDRRLDRVGGDPNVLWDPIIQGIALIDHDGALDPDFDEAEFKREHVFRDSRPFLERDFLEKWRTRFESAIYGLDRIWEEVPEEWFQDESGVEKCSLSRHDIEAALMKPENPIDGILP